MWGRVCRVVNNTLSSGSGGPGFKPLLSRCFLRQGTLSLFTQVYKWVPVTYRFGVTLRWPSILPMGE